MTNRTLTAVILRYAGLLLFLKIFDHFGSYFMTVYFTAIIPFFEESFHSDFNKFFYNGTFLLISNVVISFLLVFRAERLSKFMVKEETEIKVDLNPENLIKVILITTGLLWLASSIYLLPDLIEYTRVMYSRLNNIDIESDVDFSPFKYIIQLILGLLFIFRIGKISKYLMKRIEKKNA